MSWSRSEVECLIDEYEKHPCLYATKTPLYKNKHARIQALNAVQSALSKYNKNVSVHEIKTKFNSLKTTFLQERRKEEASKYSGTGNDELYIPTLWYYKKLMFLLEHHMARPSVDSYSLISQSVDDATAEEPIEEAISPESIELGIDVDENSWRQVSPQPMRMSPGATTSIASEKPRAPKRKRTEPDALKDISGAMRLLSEKLLNKSQPPSRYTSFANFVASKMSQMVNDVADEIEEEILQIIYKGIKKSKTINMN